MNTRAITGLRKDIDPDKALTIGLGDTAGELAAREMFEGEGIAAAAATLNPRPYEGYYAAFCELWKGGDEPWLERAKDCQLAIKNGAHPYYIKAFDTAFARGARRWCEMLVRGYLDARAGVPFAGPDGETLDALKARVDLMSRRAALGNRVNLIYAYETGHRLFTNKNGK